ncbi:hypothetical protein GCM10027570_39250 [Streptomonospora sediminis]
MNNEALNRLRVPAAWALLSAVGLHMLGGLIYIFGHGVTYDATIVGNFSSTGSSNFYSPLLIGLLVAAVVLVATAPVKTSVNFPVVLVALIMTGIAALMGLIGLIMGFINANETGELADGFTSFLSIAGELAIIAIAGLFMMRVFSDQTLVPRSAPQGVPMGQPGFPPHTGGQQQFAPQTGAQQSFAPQPGYATGGQPAYQQQPQQQDWGAAQQPAYGGAPAAQPGMYDPNQSGAYSNPGQPGGYDPNQPGMYDPNQSGAYSNPGQPGGYDPNQSGAYNNQQQYADVPAAQGYAPQEPQAQQPYGGDPAQQQPYAQGWGQQPADAYPQSPAGQDPYQPGYSQSGGQQSYGQEWQQQGYGQTYQPGYDPYSQQPYPGTGGQQPYATGAGQPDYSAGTGGQQPYATGAGQPDYSAGSGGQPAYGSPYDPAQYAPAPQPGADAEQAAQDAMQYGWYQQPGEQPAPAAEPRRDTPLDSFFSEESATEKTAQIDPVFGAGYGQQHGEGTDTPQGWYRDDDRR